MSSKPRLSPFRFNPAAHTVWAEAVREHEAGNGEPLGVMLRTSAASVPAAVREYLAALAETTAKRWRGRPADYAAAVQRLYRDRRIVRMSQAARGLSRADVIAEIAQDVDVSDKTVAAVLTKANAATLDDESPT